MPASATAVSPIQYRWHAETTPAGNMAYDQEQARAGGWSLRCYTWDAPAITYGYFQPVEPFVDLPRLERAGIATAKRPTGGGIVLHGGDLTYTVVAPRSSISWRSATEAFLWAGELVAGVLRTLGVPAEVVPQSLDSPSTRPFGFGPRSGSLGTLGFCGVHPALGDVLVAGRKLAGCAVRRCRTAWLLQGYLNLQPTPEPLLACLKTPWPERLQGASTDLQSVLKYIPTPEQLGEQLFHNHRENG